MAKNAIVKVVIQDSQNMAGHQSSAINSFYVEIMRRRLKNSDLSKEAKLAVLENVIKNLREMLT